MGSGHIGLKLGGVDKCALKCQGAVQGPKNGVLELIRVPDMYTVASAAVGSVHIGLKLGGVDKCSLKRQGEVQGPKKWGVGVDQGPGHVHSGLLQLWGVVILGLNLVESISVH